MDSHCGDAPGARDGWADLGSLRWLGCAAVAIALAIAFATASSTAQSGRADGAVPIPVSGLRGSLQNPCFSPDGTRIALTRWPRRYNEGLASVHVADLAQRAVLARVSPRGATGVNLPGTCWNAATDRIVFSLERDAPDWPYSSTPGGSDLRRLARLRGRVAIEPSFAPDGRRIVFEVSKYDAEGSGSIYVANVDGTGLRRLTRGVGRPSAELVAHRGPDRLPTAEGRGLGRMDDPARRQGLRNVTRTRRMSETDIAWAPDGKRIVFSSDAHGEQIAALVVMNADGGARTRVTRARGWYDGAPSWSPDGTTIAFEARRGEPDGSRGTRLYRIAAP